VRKNAISLHLNSQFFAIDSSEACYLLVVSGKINEGSGEQIGSILIATNWEIGDKEYMQEAVKTIVSAMGFDFSDVVGNHQKLKSRKAIDLKVDELDSYETLVRDAGT
jgi:SET domain-containing protein